MMTRTSSALIALTVALAVAGTPVALANTLQGNHWDHEQETPLASAGVDDDDDDGVKDAWGCDEGSSGAEAYVEYLAGPGGFTVGTEAGDVSAHGDTYYLCIGDNANQGLWKETNGLHGLQVGEDSHCTPGGGAVACAPSPGATPPSLA